MDGAGETSLRRRPIPSDSPDAIKDGDDRSSPSSVASREDGRECEDLSDHEAGTDDKDVGSEIESRDDESASDSEDGDSVHSEDSLLAASLQKISETMSGIGERMGRLESQLEEKMNQLGDKVAEIETRLNETVGELEAKFKNQVEKTKVNIEQITHWAWKSMPFDKLPAWLQDNEYLTHQHRPPMNSFRGCFKSMFRMHTETWNIWTHFLGFVFFVLLCLGIYVYGDYITFLFEDIDVYQLPATEQAMLFCFFLAAMICLSCSAMFHLFNNHSQTVYYVFSCLDYSGIAILITGSSIPAYYYGFYCHTVTRYVHMTIAALLCIASVIISLWKKFSTRKYRPLRFTIFVLFGVYGVIPTLQIAIRDGLEKQHIVQAGTGILVMGALYLFGALLYVLRFPERVFPGKFNTWASSHQIFHVCVVCAALVHYDTLLSMIKYRMTIGSCALELFPVT